MAKVGARVVFLVNPAMHPELAFEELETKVLRLMNGDAWTSRERDVNRVVFEIAERAKVHLRAVLGGEVFQQLQVEVGVNQRGGQHRIRFVWPGVEPVHGRVFATIVVVDSSALGAASG